MNPEMPRHQLYIDEFGEDFARVKARENVFLYRKAALGLKTKHGKKHPYYAMYVHAAWNCRKLTGSK